MQAEHATVKTQPKARAGASGASKAAALKAADAQWLRDAARPSRLPGYIAA
jgi:hypothetical protein